MPSLSVCVTVAEDMSAADRDALLARVDSYMGTGISPERAQRMAASDMLADIAIERAELLELARAQHPDLYAAAAEPAPVELPQRPELEEDAIRFSRAETVTTGRIRRSIEELMDAALSMQDWRKWYELHEPKMIEAFGHDAPLMKRLLSITSQAATVQSNFKLALKAYQQWYSLEPFEGYLPSVATNLTRLRAGQDIRGPKIEQYDKAVDGYAGGVAVDRHIAQLMFNVDKPNKAQQKAARRRVVEIADRLGWAPREVQSALWAFNQVRKGTDPNEVASYATLIDRNAGLIFQLTIDAEFARREAGGFRAFRNVAGAVGRGERPTESRVAGVEGFARDEPQVGPRGALRASIDTPEFRAWFGGSKAVDENGDPMVMYAAVDPDPVVRFSKADTMAAINSLPPGLKVKWVPSASQFHVTTPSGEVIATGKKVTTAVQAALDELTIDTVEAVGSPVIVPEPPKL